MASGRCPSCGRSFEPGEVTGVGILRSRPAADGGPLMEFTCPRCAHRLRLIPYGQGRYALPGEPPPPPVPPTERSPPWVGPEGKAEAERVAAPPPPPPPPPRAAPEPPPQAPAGEEEEPPLTVEDALSLLGVGPTAERGELEKAFRRKSRLCHPDKVAHLDGEFQVLAERKFKRLKGAFDLLTQ